MPTEESYAIFILDQLSSLPDVAVRKMMGEYVLYHRGKVVGGIYDNRLLLKAVPVLLMMVEEPELEKPYETGKPLLKVTEVENRELLCRMVEAVSSSLPETKTKRRRNHGSKD
ncbi:MAG: TfoX/Sxy family protein [Spirochaetales bacterium]|nr:TfoX/Sxy family protein [Candidatus Physcosoma equi]